MKNRIIALILVLALMLPFEAAFAKVSEDKVPELMEALEFISSKDAVSDETITRGEFVTLAAKLVTISNYKNLVDPCKFADVSEEDECYDAVNLLQQMGVIHGETDSEFRPNDPIELNHACKILIHIMGYEHFAVNGNYLVVADQRGLLSGINVDGMTFNHKTALKLIYNTLEADISDYNIVDGMSSNEYSEIFMTKRLGIYKIKGTVTDDGVISLTGESNIRDGYISVGGGIFKNETGNNDLLGYTIEGFYKKDLETEENVMIYAFVKEAESVVVTLTGDDIKSYANNTYTYYLDIENDETEELYVDPNYKLIYNGKLFKAEEALPTFTLTIDQMMKPVTGQVKLTDSNADGDYDIISVMDLKSYVVKSIDYDEYIIYGKPEATPGTVDFSTAKDSLNIKTPGGEYITDFGKILVDNVVSVGLSADGKHAEIIIANSKGTGYIQSADNVSYIIDDVTYDFSPEYVTYIETVDEPAPGMEADYYLTYENKIIYAHKAGESDILYARITGLKMKNGMDTTLKLQLYLENNSCDYYGFAKNVLIDGVKYKDQDQDIYNYLFVTNDFSATGEYFGIVRVKLNADQEIYFIDTPYKESVGNPNTLTEGDDTLHIIKNGERQVARYVSKSFSFQGNWIADEDAKFIVVAEKTTAPEDDMVMTNMTSTDATNLNNQFIEFMAFSTKANSFIADAVVRIVERYKGTVTGSLPWYVLLKVSDALNGEGDPVKKVTVTEGKTIKDYYTESATSLVCQCNSTQCEVSPIVPEPGDIVKFITTNNVIPDGGMFVGYDYSEDKQWVYVSTVKHELSREVSPGSYYTRYALLTGYLNRLEFLTSQWVVDYFPWRVNDTYRENTITYGPFDNHQMVITLADAYAISVDINKGTMRPKLTSELKQYNDGLGIMKKYFLFMNEGRPYCIVEYDN